LHTHCVVFNATFDPVEQRWKALQNYEMLRAKKFAENVYYHELARQLRSFGYQINSHPRGDFQIEGVSEEICDRFSKRDAEVDRALAKLLAEKPELAGANLKERRATLAVKTRGRKQKDLSRAELRTLWDAQLSDAERISLHQLSNRSENIANTNQRVEIGEAMQWAEDHLFDRNSVVLECQLWQQALERARGENFTLAELKDCSWRRNYIRNPERPNEVTLREVLLRELEIVQSVKYGAGACRPFVENPRPPNPKLDDEQRKALDALLNSTNTVSLFRGGAGTGKSFVLRELVEQIQQSDRRVIVLAPQRQQVVDIRFDVSKFGWVGTNHRLIEPGERLKNSAQSFLKNVVAIGGQIKFMFLRLLFASKYPDQFFLKGIKSLTQWHGFNHRPKHFLRSRFGRLLGQNLSHLFSH
jgi:hypothetical protein